MVGILQLFEKKLDLFNRKICKFFNKISCLLLLIMPLPVFFDVLARYLFKKSIPGAIEIESYHIIQLIKFISFLNIL